jgi:alkanesulfonate monooxygenase
MPRQIRLNAFDMNCVGHQSPGLWTHPRDRADRYNTLDHWVELARILERGKFDALFLADVLGVYDVYRGSPDAAIANAVQVPVNDPLLLIPAMAYVTRNLGFGVTCAVSYEHPYTLARRFSTLDHLTGGRIGWNVVTGYLNSAAKGVGLSRQPEHDTRYEIAEEYMQIVYKLWEGSWEDGAVLRDHGHRVFARPDKVHRIRHDGTYFQIEAMHLCEPSPQRTPLLYQAGASSRGRQFAATHAECVFINGPSKQVIAPIVADIRRRAGAAGRNPAEILILTMMTVITAEASKAARAKLEEYRSYASEEGALVLCPAGPVLISRPTDPTSRSATAGRTRRPRRWKPSPLLTRTGCGRCGKSRSTPRSGAAGRWWSARPKRLRTSCSPGSKRPT